MKIAGRVDDAELAEVPVGVLRFEVTPTDRRGLYRFRVLAHDVSGGVALTVLSALLLLALLAGAGLTVLLVLAFRTGGALL